MPTGNLQPAKTFRSSSRRSKARCRSSSRISLQIQRLAKSGQRRLPAAHSTPIPRAAGICRRSSTVWTTRRMISGQRRSRILCGVDQLPRFYETIKENDGSVSEYQFNGVVIKLIQCWRLRRRQESRPKLQRLRHRACEGDLIDAPAPKQPVVTVQDQQAVASK